MYGIGAYFAIRNAIRAFKSAAPAGAGAGENLLSFDAPFTAEKVLLNLYSEKVSKI